jgi:tRNA pseudouridine38-40 synthase
MAHYRMTVSYDGTDYSGWQRQPNRLTIQGELEKALHRFRERPVGVNGSGRTDAGVHALGQVAHFQAELSLGDDELRRALNGQLPGDIRVTSLERTHPDFHARKSARSKIYRYRIVNSPGISPFDMRYALHFPRPLDLPAMRRGAALFVREADFTPFSSNRLLYPVRRVLRSEITRAGEEVHFTVEATGFLKYMVRTMMGTLLEIGTGRLLPEGIDALFKRRTRSLGSPTAPPRGLCLMTVKY